MMFVTQFKYLTFLILSLAAFAAAGPPGYCDVSRAESILASIATGKAFCSSLIHPHGNPCQTITRTVTQTTSASQTCATKTRTVTTRIVFTSTEFTETDLPQPTSTAYGSTVFVTITTVVKRDVQTPSAKHSAISTDAFATGEALATPANRHGHNPTPSALSMCAAKTISAACSILVPISTTTVTTTVTSTCGKPCKTEVTVTDTVVKRTVTETTTIIGTPEVASITTLSSGTLTLTVPAQCLGPTYEGGSIDPDEFGVYFPDYPDFPIDPVYCCLSCFDTPNCVASYFDQTFQECERLIRVNETAADGPPNAACPLGTDNFPFSNPGDAILRGPCG